MSKEKSISGASGRPFLRAVAGPGEEVRRTRAVTLPYGAASAVLRGDSLVAVEWEETEQVLEAVLAERYPGVRIVEPGECAAGRLLLSYSAGKPVTPGEVASVRLDWKRVRGFHREVLRELAGLPYGSTITYGGLAAKAGRAGAARAVGAAVARNPWPVIVPCHRVVGTGGKMVGFGKGIDAKRTLLAFEGGDAGGDCTRNRQNV